MAPSDRISVAERFLQTPEGRLYKAAKEGDLEALDAACQEGARLDVPHPEFGSQPMVIAALHGHVQVVHYLLEEQAELEQRNKFGWTALLAASSRGELTLCGYLVARKADVRASDNLGRTALHNAVARGCESLALGLIDEGADVNAKTLDGRTVLSIELGRTQRSGRELEDRLARGMGLPFPKGKVKEMLGDRPPAFALVFPGQGSQRLGMLGWTEDHETAWPLVQRANELLGYDLFEITEFGPEERLHEVDVCQPAIFVAAMCGLEWWREQEGQAAAEPSAAAGLSCGELAALCVAGCFDFDDGVRLARFRGELQRLAANTETDTACPQRMLSIVGLSVDEVETICREAVERASGDAANAEVCCIANRLFPGGLVLSGTARAIAAAKELARERGAQKISELRGCAAAFHTELMKPAQDSLRRHLEELLNNGRLRSPRLTVYSSQSGERWLPGTPPTVIVEAMVSSLINPGNWEQTCKAIIDDGVEYFWEIGPMKQLKAMMRHINEGQWTRMRCVDC
eukprot:TRINITY_DN1110_c0_g2_i1.p1 TRINITY_DN1110_c0_g2~~TRINITY_DN1110_c0_g2_i1.p1  ORF type:complete len:517 (-),score=101.02 TRINITY_DN1110_c0_g2_i1:15-1565(-)